MVITWPLFRSACVILLIANKPFLYVDHCSMPLGMEDGRITKSRLRASSMYNTYYGPYNARLQARNYGSTRGGWIAKIRNTQQWIQVDLEKVATLKGLATQGRYDANQFVRSYIVTYSRNGRRFVPYREGRRTRVIHFWILNKVFPLVIKAAIF